MPDLTPNFDLPKPLGTETPDGPAQISALADAVDVALLALATNVVIGGSNGDGSFATIPNGNTWNDREAAINITTSGPGLLMVVGSVTLQHNVSSGDPEGRVDITGPVTSVVRNDGKLGTGSVGGIEVQASVPVLGKAKVTGAGTVTIQRQVRHNTSSGTGHQFRNFDIYWVFVEQAN